MKTFIQETLRRAKTSYSTLQVALYYLILLKDHLPNRDFTQEQPQDEDCRAMQCGRRMFLSALILASKYLQDRNYSTRAWGKISGLAAGLRRRRVLQQRQPGPAAVLGIRRVSSSHHGHLEATGEQVVNLLTDPVVDPHRKVLDDHEDMSGAHVRKR